MKKKSLLKTNPYLKNSKIRKVMIMESAITSTAIEGVHINFKQKIKNKRNYSD